MRVLSTRTAPQVTRPPPRIRPDLSEILRPTALLRLSAALDVLAGAG